MPTAVKQRKHDKALAEMLAEVRKDAPKTTRKSAVTMKAVEGEDGTTVGPMAPTDEQLVKINQFTRSTKTADELVVFPTMSCNDIYDRDDERFTTACIDKFAKLEAPLSSVGKSFMVSHDYSKLPVGRVFDVDTQNQDGAKFLKNWVYLPNTEANKSFIENVDFGIYWAVSVGVTVDKATCTICQEHMYKSRWFGDFCVNGHDKGMWYDPKSEETDEWGYPLPVAEGTKGAIKCQTDLDDPIDFYELSMVYLGAQYMAELGKQKSFKSIMKAAAGSDVPTIGLSSKDVKSLELPIPHAPDKVAEAREKYEVTTDEEGNPTWKDENSLVWVFVAEDNEVFALGKAEDAEDDEDEVDDTVDDEADDTEDDEDEVDDDDTSDDEDDDTDDEDKEVTPPTITASEGEKMAKVAALALAKRVKMPAAMVSAIAEGGDSAEEVFKSLSKAFKAAEDEVTTLEPLAKVGSTRLKELRAEVVEWYVKANTEAGAAQQTRVSTKVIDKLLDRVDDDPDILKQMIEDYKSTAQAKFPKAVRRSSFPEDVHQGKEVSLETDDQKEKPNSSVQRIHG